MAAAPRHGRPVAAAQAVVAAGARPLLCGGICFFAAPLLCAIASSHVRVFGNRRECITPIFTYSLPTTFAAFFCRATTIFAVLPIHHAFGGALPPGTILAPFARSCVVVDQPSRVVARPLSVCRPLRPHALRPVLRHELLRVVARPSSTCKSSLVLAQNWLSFSVSCSDSRLGPIQSRRLPI